MGKAKIWITSLLSLFLFALPFFISSFASSSKLDALSSIAASMVDGEALNVDIPVEIGLEEGAQLADTLSRAHYTKKFDNAKLTLTGDFQKVDRVIVAPSLETHTNPKGEWVLDCFEIVVSAPVNCFVSPDLKDETVMMGQTVAGYCSGTNADFFLATLGSYVIVGPDTDIQGKTSINFDLSKGVSSNSSYLTYLREYNLFDNGLILNGVEKQADFDRALNNWLNANRSLDPLFYFLSAVPIIVLLGLVYWLRPRLWIPICSFVAAYLVFQTIQAFVSSWSFLTLLPLLLGLFGLIGSIGIIVWRGAHD